MAPGYAADDGAALHFVGDELAQVVASRPEARALPGRAAPGDVVETRLATRFLGDDCVRAADRAVAALAEADAVDRAAAPR